MLTIPIYTVLPYCGIQNTCMGVGRNSQRASGGAHKCTRSAPTLEVVFGFQASEIVSGAF